MNDLLDRLAELEAQNESLRASNRGICALADDRSSTIYKLRVEVLRLQRENERLRADADKLYVDGFADGANLRTVGERVMDLSEDFGVPVC